MSTFLQLSILKNAALECKLCSGQGGVGGAVELCKPTQGMVTVMAFQADSTIRPGAKFTLSLPAMTEFLGPITSL